MNIKTGFKYDATGPWILKDPNASLKYVVDWAAKTNGSGVEDWLGTGVTITSHTVTVQTGLTLVGSAITDANTSVTITLSGGTVGNVYTVATRITASDAQIDERTFRVKVVER